MPSDDVQLASEVIAEAERRLAAQQHPIDRAIRATRGSTASIEVFSLSPESSGSPEAEHDLGAGGRVPVTAERRRCRRSG